MNIIYNNEKIEKTINNLSLITNIPMSFVPINWAIDFKATSSPIKSYRSEFCQYIQKNLNMHQKCLDCDKMILNKTQYTSHICHTGLYDATFPVVISNITVGYLLFGCFRCPNSPKTPYGVDDETAVKLYKKRPFFTQEQIKGIEELLPDILFNDAIVIEYSNAIKEITNYINLNLTKKISLQTICKEFHISKNSLYKLFTEHYKTTPGNYITNLRIEKSKELIPDKNLTIHEIANLTGFDSYPHFSRAFKKHTGFAPAHFRKSFSPDSKKITPQN